MLKRTLLPGADAMEVDDPIGRRVIRPSSNGVDLLPLPAMSTDDEGEWDDDEDDFDDEEDPFFFDDDEEDDDDFDDEDEDWDDDEDEPRSIRLAREAGRRAG